MRQRFYTPTSAPIRVFTQTHLELKRMFKKTNHPQLWKHVRHQFKCFRRLAAAGAHQRAGGPQETERKKAKTINDSKAWHRCIDSLTPINECRYSLSLIKVAAFWNIKAVLTASETLRYVGWATTSHERGGKKAGGKEGSVRVRCCRSWWATHGVRISGREVDERGIDASGGVKKGWKPRRECIKMYMIVLNWVTWKGRIAEHRTRWKGNYRWTLAFWLIAGSP